jgi:formylglycine-generating enzyme required for sulfatase activity
MRAAALRLVPKIVTNSIGMVLIEIPAGKFTMGSPAGEKQRGKNEEQVAVTLTKPFWLGTTEVTQGQWQKVMGTAPWEGKPFVKADKDCPTSCVDWNDATAFCQRLTNTDHTNGKLPAGESYRLPTEAEWEYACRAGTTTAFSFGNDEQQLGHYGWFSGNVFSAGEAYPHAVGLKKPNPWGLYDMHGSVFEWCSDWYDRKLLGGTDPVGPRGGSLRVLCGGGCWGDNPGSCRSAYRDGGVPSYRGFGLGFRVARSQLAQ